MAVPIQRRRQVQCAPSRRQRNSRKGRHHSSIVVSSLKAGQVGGFGLVVLIFISLISPSVNLPFIFPALLVMPTFVIVCLATGLLAAIYAGDQVTYSQQAGEVGWMAGFWAGICGAVAAMFMAAMGVLMIDFGQGIVHHFTPEQFASWGSYVTPGTVALTSRVFGALVVYGLIGALLSALLSTIGGMIYLELRGN